MKVGLTLPQAAVDGDGATWAAILGLARLAEEGGADSLWVCDHFLYRRDEREIGYHEPFALLAALAASTRRVELGPLVAAMSFRSPGLLAKIAATLNEVADGRLILGVGSGWHEAEYAAFGYPFDNRVDRFAEAVGVLRALLDGDRVSLAGRWYELDDAVILPPPNRRVPLLVAATGPRMLRLAARYADAWQTAWFGLPDGRFAEARAHLVEACAAEGREWPIEVFVGLEATGDGEGGDAAARLPIEASAIEDGLHRWESEGAAHLQLAVHPATSETFAVALEGIGRYRRGS